MLLRNLTDTQQDLLRRLGDDDGDVRYQAYLDGRELPPDDLVHIAMVEIQPLLRKKRNSYKIFHVGCMNWIALLPVVILFVCFKPLWFFPLLIVYPLLAVAILFVLYDARITFAH